MSKKERVLQIALGAAAIPAIRSRIRPSWRIILGVVAATGVVTGITGLVRR